MPVAPGWLRLYCTHDSNDEEVAVRTRRFVRFYRTEHVNAPLNFSFQFKANSKAKDILVGKPERDFQGNVGADGRIILKCTYVECGRIYMAQDWILRRAF
jgi:hypothetical protein